jgi:hypothetical protein
MALHSLFLVLAIDIVGPSSVPVGDLFELRAGKTAQAYAWLVVPSKTFFQADGGSRIAFASGKPGLYTFVLAAIVDGKVEIQPHIVSVGDAPPGPQPPNPPPVPVPPGPIPPRPPDPPAPPVPPTPTALGVSRVVFDEAMKLSPEAKAKAPDLSAAFDSLAAAISAGTLSGLAIGKETRAKFNEAVGDRAAEWKAVDKAVQAKFRLLVAEKKLQNTDDLAAAYREVAGGLAKIK